MPGLPSLPLQAQEWHAWEVNILLQPGPEWICWPEGKLYWYVPVYQLYWYVPPHLASLAYHAVQVWSSFIGLFSLTLFQGTHSGAVGDCWNPAASSWIFCLFSPPFKPQRFNSERALAGPAYPSVLSPSKRIRFPVTGEGRKSLLLSLSSWRKCWMKSQTGTVTGSGHYAEDIVGVGTFLVYSFLKAISGEIHL